MKEHGEVLPGSITSKVQSSTDTGKPITTQDKITQGQAGEVQSLMAKVHGGEVEKESIAANNIQSLADKSAETVRISRPK